MRAGAIFGANEGSGDGHALRSWFNRLFTSMTLRLPWRSIKLSAPPLCNTTTTVTSPWSPSAAPNWACRAIHRIPPRDTGPVELTLVAESLDEVVDQAAAAGIAVAAPIAETVFGRQVTVLTPDGRSVKINEFRRGPAGE